MNKWFLTMLILCISTSLTAQREGLYTKINQTISPAPTAASLGTYGSFSMSGYSGVPAINIPLLDLQLKDFHLPITLNYNAGGVRVEDISSWVGTGWSLNAGGVVTRSIVDVPDDSYASGNFGGTGFLYQNWYLPGYRYVSGSWPNRIDPDPGGTAPKDISGILKSIRADGYDTEPDIFSYNFNGRSGKFLFDTGHAVFNQRIYQIPYQDIKIDVIANSTSNQASPTSGWINQFIITDEKGTRYYFDSTELTKTEVYGTANLCESCGKAGAPDWEGGGTGTSYHSTVRNYSSWFVSKIITINNDTIRFSYVNESYAYQMANSTNGIVANLSRSGAATSLMLNDVQGCALSMDDFGTNIAENFTFISAKRLTSITGPGFLVTFDALHPRQDILNDSALTSIKLYSIPNPDATPMLVKRIDLKHSYMGDLSKPQLQNFVINSGNYGDSRLHLMLDSILNIDNTGQVISNYNFAYNNTVPLPDRLSYRKDFWGYFCDNGCNTLFPKLYVYPDGFPTNPQSIAYNRFCVFPLNGYLGTRYILPGANRNTNPVSILSGTLKSIQFPTGGVTSFTFEPHTFLYNNQTFTGGGLRLKQMISYDGLNHSNDIIHNYSYTSSADNITTTGVLFNLPVFAYAENAYQHDLSTVPYTKLLNVNDTSYYKLNIVRSDVSQASLNGSDGINVGYREITESQINNGKIVRTYTVPGSYGLLSDYSSDGCDVNQSGFCDGYFQAPTPICIDNYMPISSNSPDVKPVQIDLIGTDAFDTPNSFPFAPSPNYDWNRGLLQSERYYNNSSLPVKTVNYQYGLFTPGNKGLKYINGLKKTRLLNYAMMAYAGDVGGGGGFYTGGTPRYDVIVHYKLLAQVGKLPLSETTYTYDQVTGASLVDSVVLQYKYNNMLPASQTHYESNGKITTVATKYIADIDTSQAIAAPTMAGYYNMLRNHLVRNVVENYTQVSTATGNNAATGNYLTYKAAIPKVDTTFVLRTNAPLADFIPSVTVYNNAIKDARYEPDDIFDSYDSKGNILQGHKYGDQNIAYLWGYNSQYPVAEIIGTDYQTAAGYVNADILQHPSTDQQLRDELNKIRTALAGSKVLVTTYTYMPSVGMTSKTDPTGKTVYYEYDGFGRLKITKDQDGKILKQYNYQYQISVNQ